MWCRLVQGVLLKLLCETQSLVQQSSLAPNMHSIDHNTFWYTSKVLVYDRIPETNLFQVSARFQLLPDLWKEVKMKDMFFQSALVPSIQGFYRFWKSGKSGKIERHFSSQGKVREFGNFFKNQGKIREF